MMSLYFLIFLLFIMGNLIYISKKKHLLIILLILEFMVLVNYLLMNIWMYSSFEFNLYFMMTYLVFCVGEGALGLSILVSLVRIYGNDYFQMLSIL